jgi:hypothetical protein
MRRIITYYLILFCIVLAGRLTSFAQGANRYAKAIIAETKLVAEDTIQFKVKLIRTVDNWERFANGTFDIAVAGVVYENIELELLPGSSDLNPSSYTITPRVITAPVVPGSRITRNRLSITVLGPTDYTQSKLVEKDTAKPLILGIFRIFTKDKSRFPTRVALNWLQPYAYYQASAYKINADSLPFHIGDNNIEMSNFTEFVAEFLDMPKMVIVCSSVYLGVKRVEVNWSTTTEIENYGFIVLRGMLPFGETDINKAEFTDTIATYQTDPSLLGAGTSFGGHSYKCFDTVPVRGERYVYKIISVRQDLSENTSCSTILLIPFAVIEEARPSPNPFTDNTTIEYKLGDDVYLSVRMYDVTGKEVQVFMQNTRMAKGRHKLSIQPDKFATQGLYDVIFLAVPINDVAVDFSRAVVKIQLIR